MQSDGLNCAVAQGGRAFRQIQSSRKKEVVRDKDSVNKRLARDDRLYDKCSKKGGGYEA
jgi:hypothetical protein